MKDSDIIQLYWDRNDRVLFNSSHLGKSYLHRGSGVSERDVPLSERLGL